MARTSVRGQSASSSYRASAGAPVSSGAEAPSSGVQEADGATLAAVPAGAVSGQPGAVAGPPPPGGLGAGAAIRAARLRDAERALERGDMRGAVGLLLEAVRGEVG